MKKVFCLVSLCLLTVACPQSVKAQYGWQEDAEPAKLRLDSALEYRIYSLLFQRAKHHFGSMPIGMV